MLVEEGVLEVTEKQIGSFLLPFVTFLLFYLIAIVNTLVLGKNYTPLYILSMFAEAAC
jgi:hypothetical protein